MRNGLFLIGGTMGNNLLGSGEIPSTTSLGSVTKAFDATGGDVWKHGGSGTQYLDYGDYLPTRTCHFNRTTWAFWGTAAATANAILACHSDNNNTDGWQFGYNDNGGTGLGLSCVRSVANVEGYCGAAVTANVPFCFVATYDGGNVASTGIKLYFNGQPQTLTTFTTSSATSIATSGQNLYIGRRIFSAGVLTGTVRALGIFSRVWTDDEVAAWSDDPEQLFASPVVRVYRFMDWSLPGGATTLVLAGARSEESPGASSLLGSGSFAGGVSDERPGAAGALGTLVAPPALLYDAYGVPVVAGTSAPSSAAPDAAAGAAQAAGALALAGAASEERAGALSLAQTLLLASGLSQEQYGAPVLSALSLLSATATADLVGATTTLGLLAQAGAQSEERAGALTILQTVVLLLASAAEDSPAGAATLSAAAQLAGALSSERAGASTLAGLASLAAALSEEIAGAVQVGANLTAVSAGAGGPSGEQPGATTLAGTNALAGARPEDVVGALALLGAGVLAGAPSSEAAGAITITSQILLLLAGAPSEEQPGAGTVAGLNVLPPSPGEYIVGAPQAQGLIILVPGLSEERAGALVTSYADLLFQVYEFLFGPPLRATLGPSVLAATVETSVLRAVIPRSESMNCALDAADFNLTEGDLGPVLRATLLAPASKLPQDLTGATVTIEIQRADGTGPLLGGACTIIDALAGIVGYGWQAGDTAVAGTYKFRFKAIVGGITMHWPNNRSYTLIIEPQLAAPP